MCSVNVISSSSKNNKIMLVTVDLYSVLEVELGNLLVYIAFCHFSAFFCYCLQHFKSDKVLICFRCIDVTCVYVCDVPNLC